MIRRFLVLTVLLAGTPVSVQAQDYLDQITSQLTAQGFVGIEVERTLLGRMRITGESKGGEREIILNPNTGEILRDLWQPNSDESAPMQLLRDDGGTDVGAAGSTAPEAKDASPAEPGAAGAGPAGSDRSGEAEGNGPDTGSGSGKGAEPND